jgi:hypothetical protein
LNTSQDAALFVGQLTEGPWSAGSPPDYDWATKSGSPAGPGSQIRDTTVIDNVRTDSFGPYSADISPIVDAWVNGGDPNYGLGAYLASNYQGAGFTDPQIEFDITSNVYFDLTDTGNAGSQLVDLGSHQTVTVDDLGLTIDADGGSYTGIRTSGNGIGVQGAGPDMINGESLTFVFDQTVNLKELLIGPGVPGGSLAADLPGTANDMLIDTRSSAGPFSLGNFTLLPGEEVTFTAQALDGSNFGGYFAGLMVSVPEPSAMALALLGLLGLVGFRRRGRR